MLQSFETKVRIKVERAIVGELLKVLIEKFGSVGVDDGEGDTFKSNDPVELEDLIFNLDECYIWTGLNSPENLNEAAARFVYLIFGNGNLGLDLISDYSVGLEATLKPVFDKIQAFEGGHFVINTFTT